MISSQPKIGLPAFLLPDKKQPDRKDILIALVIIILALAAYIRTLAPDVLYGDSAEFQSLSYTLGVTHSTGYPTYIFLGRLIGLLPFNIPAWRVNLLSAVCAGITLGGVYWLARYFTRNRIGPVLGALALGISYTFWSQAVIAEVYTPGLAFITLVLILLFRWQVEPGDRSRSLLLAALLAGIGFGVHASVWLIAPPAVFFVIWNLWRRSAARTEWIRSISAGAAGALFGLLIFLGAFIISDRLNSPTSFIRTTLYPSREFWGLEASDFGSSFKHLQMTVFSVQWGNALFPGGDFSFSEELTAFIDRLANLEFSPPVLLFALAGFVLMVLAHPVGGVFYLVYFLFALFFILNYRVGDKYVFYLSLYIPLTVAMGAGTGFALSWVRQFLQPLPVRSYRLLYLLPLLFFITMVVQPSASARWQALQEGKATFVTETYAYPIEDLDEPRLIAERWLTGVSDNAVFVLDWRALYTTAYIAHVERGMTNTLFFEAMPYGNQGEIASSLISQLEGYLEEGRPVYAEYQYPGLEGKFRLMPVAGNLYKVSLTR